MVRTILAEWLAGEKTLPRAVRDWSDGRSRREVASLGALFVAQTLVSFLLVTGTLRAVESLLSLLQGTPPAVILLAILVGELTVVVVEVRDLSRNVETIANWSERDAIGAAGTDEGNTDNRGDEIDDIGMLQRASGRDDR